MKKLFSWLILLGLLALLFVALLEFGLRFFAPEGPEPAIQRTYGPTPHGLSSEEFAAAAPVKFELNDLGVRTESMHTTSKPAGVIRVLCLGDGNDFPLFNYDDTWPGLLEKTLNETSAIQVQTATYGEYSKSGLQIMRKGLELVATLKPDVVVVSFGGHTLLANNGATDISGMDPGSLLVPKQSWKRKLRKYSQVAQILRNRREAKRLASVYPVKRGEENLFWISRKPAQSDYWKSKRDDTVTGGDQAVNFLASLVGELIKRTQESGAQCVLLTAPTLLHEALEYTDGATPGGVELVNQPKTYFDQEKARKEMGMLWRRAQLPDGTLVRIGPLAVRAALEKQNTALAATAKAAGATVVDLMPKIQPSMTRFVDEFDLSIGGHQAVAKELVPVIRNLATGATKKTNG